MKHRSPAPTLEILQSNTMREQFRHWDEAALFIDILLIDYSYIDMYNTDITF